MTPRGTLGLCCVYIAQLMTHTAIYTLTFTLQLCYKPLGIMQRVAKSQKVHISSQNRLYTKQKIIFTPNTKKVTKHGSVIRSWLRLNPVLNGLSLILKKSQKIGSVIRSWFTLNSVSNGLSLILKKVTENWFCNKIMVQVKFRFKRTFTNAKKSQKLVL